MMLLATMLLTLTTQTAWAWDGSGTEIDPYLIKTTGDLSDLSTQSQTNNFDGVYFKLYNDITFNNTQSNNFVPIGTSTYHFQGFFDGNGKTIRGVRISSTEGNMALFSRLGENGVVKNLKVADTRIVGFNQSGIITGYCTGTVEECSVGSDVVLHTIYSNGTLYGSIAGLVRDGHINHCSSAASITLSVNNGYYSCMGGLVGEINQGTIENSLFTGSLQKSTSTNPVYCHNVYAVVGVPTNGTISNCYYTNSALENPITEVSLASVVTIPSQFKVEEFQGVIFDGKVYVGQGKTFTLTSATHPSYVSTWCVFDVRKTSSNNCVAENVEHGYVMPPYDITLVYKGILPYHVTAPYDYYNIYTDDSWNILADYVAEGWDTSGKLFSLYGDMTVTKPVGTPEHPFKGTFTGNFYNHATPNKLTFNATATGNYCAPFAHISGATIKDLQVAGTVSTTYTKASGLVGKVSGTSTIQNVVSTVTVGSYYSGPGYHGGLVGEVASGASLTMSNSIFAGSLQGNSTSAWSGLVGSKSGTLSMTKCLFAPASVSVNTSNCYSLVNSSANTLTNCYYATALGTAQGTRAYTATLPEAIVPTDASAGIFYNSKLYVGSTQIAKLKYLVNAGGDGVTLSAITAKDESNNNVTVTNNGDNTYNITMPAKNITVSGVMTDLWGLAGGADGTEDHPYIITTTDGLDLLATKVNGGNNYEGKYFKLGHNINYTYPSGDTWDKEDGTTNNYTPIGFDNSNTFAGHFDGDKYTISGIRINNTNNSYKVGLFGILSTDNAEIKNVTLDDARIKSTNYHVGGILGYTGNNDAHSKVTNCHVKNVLVKGSDTVGGIVGSNRSGTVSNCTSGAIVIASVTDVAGIAGTNEGTIKDCFYYGNGVTCETSSRKAGVIAVKYGGTLQNNYYLPCTVTIGSTAYTTNNGVYTHSTSTLADVSANDGALSVYPVTLAAVTNGTIAAATKTITHNSKDYYKTGATVTVTATPDEGYGVASVTYNDGSSHTVEPVSDVYSFTMPAKAVTVSSAFSLNAFSLAYDSNNDAVLTTWNGKTAKVTLAGRTLKKDGSWNTLCLPFDVTIASSPLAGDGVTAKVFSSSSNLTDGTLRLDFINAPATIHAGTPFIVKWTGGSDISAPVFTGVEVNSTAPVAAVSADGNVTFTGTFSPFDPTTGLWFDANNTTNGACHVALSTAEPTRAGYTLTGGWNTAPDGSGSDVTTIPFDVAVYAKGTENIATLTEANPIAPLTAWSGQQTKVSFERTGLTAGKYSTICLPYDFTASETCTFYTFKGVTQDTQNNWVADIEETTAALTANTPYIFKTESATSVTFSNDAVTAAASYSDAAANMSVTDWTFQGTYSAISLPKDGEYDYGFAAGDGSTVAIGTFVHLVSGASAAPFRAYLKYTGSDANWAKAPNRAGAANDALPSRIIVRIVGANGDATVIGTLDTRTGEISTGDYWYSLDGHRLQGKPTTKGIYIHNGRKEVLK